MPPDTFSPWFEALRDGQQILALESGEGACLFQHGEEFFLLPSTAPATFDELLFNPFRMRRTRAKVLDQMGYAGARATLRPTPPGLLALRGRLDEELRRPHGEILDRYVERIRRGGSFSAGPTSDQMWTMRFDGAGFVEDWNRSAEENYESVTSPVDEASMRRRIAAAAGLTVAP